MSTPILNVPPKLNDNVRSLLDYIEREHLKAGDKLESERELARILGISRPSLREAIQVLQAQGRLMVKHGVGVFILDEVTGEKMKDAYMAQRHTIEELFQMREILEAPAVEWLPLPRAGAWRFQRDPFQVKRRPWWRYCAQMPIGQHRGQRLICPLQGGPR